jgi:hypothetical protein
MWTIKSFIIFFSKILLQKSKCNFKKNMASLYIPQLARILCLWQHQILAQGHDLVQKHY